MGKLLVQCPAVRPPTPGRRPSRDGPGKGPTSGTYNNPVAEAFDTGSFAKITESHARVIQAACDRVLSGSGSADKIAAAILALDDDEDSTPLA